jgi:hypothetical protein
MNMTKKNNTYTDHADIIYDKGHLSFNFNLKKYNLKLFNLYFG